MVTIQTLLSPRGSRLKNKFKEINDVSRLYLQGYLDEYCWQLANKNRDVNLLGNNQRHQRLLRHLVGVSTAAIC